MSIRIARLSIRDFGPLRDLVLVPGDVTVVFGQNEAGKTSCIDALARALRERVRPGNRKMLDQLRDGPGFNGGEIDLVLEPEDGGALIALLREHPSLARLFIIRDGDASLESGRSWLNAIRGRLIGIDLSRVSERVRQGAGLTPTGVLREARADERQRLRERLARLDAFLADLPNVGRLLEEMQQTERQKTAARGRIERLRLAERHERYRLARRALETVEAAQRTLGSLERYADQDLAAWREGVSALREAAAVAKSAEEETHRLRDDLALAAEEQRKREIGLDKAAARAADVMRRDLATLVDRARLARAAARLSSLWRTPLAIGAVLLLGASIGLGLQAAAEVVAARGLPLGLLAGGAAVAGLALGALSIFATSRMRGAVSLETQALAACGTVLLRATNLDECAVQLAALGAAVERAEAEREGATDRTRAIEQSLAAAERVEGERLRRLEEAQRVIAEVRARVGLSSLEQLEEKVHLRAQTASTLEEARRTVAGVLGDTSDELTLARRVESLSVPNPGVAPDPGELAGLERELEEYDERLLALRTQLTERRDRALAATGLESLAGAEAERDRLAESVAAIERDAAAGKLCLQALRELAQDIDRPLREALGSGPGAAGAYLARLTEGRYPAVVLDGDGKLAVERSDGTRFGGDVLSRGARDQLAVAVRVALVRRLLGEPGFLVLDDAFLSSDSVRRQALAAAVADLAREGWQILYFTFDPGLRDRLVGLGARLVELPVQARIGDHAA